MAKHVTSEYEVHIKFIDLIYKKQMFIMNHATYI